MAFDLELDRDAIAGVCITYGVSRLRIFGSSASRRFDKERNDVDFLVDFTDTAKDPFATYFGLKENLEALLGRRVDLVMADAVRNPYLAESIKRSEEDIFTA